MGDHRTQQLHRPHPLDQYALTIGCQVSRRAVARNRQEGTAQPRRPRPPLGRVRIEAWYSFPFRFRYLIERQLPHVRGTTATSHTLAVHRVSSPTGETPSIARLVGI